MKKLKNKKGFTLMEMLIVVAIIAILIAIAIPTFSGSLNKAKDAADEANGRALYAAMASAYLVDKDYKTPTASTSVTFEGTTYTFQTAPVFGTDDNGGPTVTVTLSDKSTVTFPGGVATAAASPKP